MMMKNYERIFSFAIVSAILILGWIIQGQLFLNYDASSLLIATENLLKGGNYINEIFTPNPPLILYIYTPLLLVSQLLKINIILVFRAYIFLIGIFSLILCYVITTKKSDQAIKFPINLLLTTLAIIFFILPVHNLGQRDHLFVLLIMPYLFLVSGRLEEGLVKPGISLLVGILAGLGLLLKPQFFIIPLLVETYYIFNKKKFFAWLRTEIIAILLMTILYLFCLIYFHPEYVYIVIPYLIRFYLYSTSSPWYRLIYNVPITFCMIVIILHIILNKDSPCQHLRTILFLSLLGAILFFFAQKTDYLYHLLPAFSFAFLLFVIQFYFSFPLDASKNKTFFTHYKLPILFGLFFILPVYSIGSSYYYSQQYKNFVLRKLITFINAEPPHQSLYFFSTNTRFSFPLIHYTQAISAQRFDCLWMVDAIWKQIQSGKDRNVLQHFRNNDYLFLKLIVADIQRYKPTLVFIDSTDDTRQFPIFDYLYYFSQNKNFRKEWEAYHYLTTINFRNTHRVLLVFQRKNS